MLALAARIAVVPREAVLPKHIEEQDDVQKPAYRKVKRGHLASHEDRLRGHGERLRLQIEKLKNDPGGQKAAPTAARKRLMQMAPLRAT